MLRRCVILARRHLDLTVHILATTTLLHKGLTMRRQGPVTAGQAKACEFWLTNLAESIVPVVRT